METPFKMKGFSGFGNSPLKTRGHGGKIFHKHTKSTETKSTPSPEAPKTGMMGTPTYYEKGYTDRKTKRPKYRKAFKYTGFGRFVRKLFGSGGGGGGGSTSRLGCSASGSCPK